MPDNLTNWGPSLGARDLILPHGFFLHFLLTLFRVGGIFAFVPVPGLKSALDPTRIGLVVLLSWLVFPLTPSGLAVPATLSGALALIVSEVSLGLVFGLSIQFLHEGVLIGAQILSVQAGYSYASTIDPTSEADSSVLQVILVLGASLFFLTLGLDRILLKAVVASFDAYPPGAFVAQASTASSVISISGEMFSRGFRVAAPIVGVLVLVDVAMALLSRLQPQMQLLNLSFPLKMLLSLAGLALAFQTLPAGVEASAETTFRFIGSFLAKEGG